jgi:Fe2+ transport system protein B
MAKAFGVAQVAINAASSIGQILVNARAAQFEYDKAIATGNASILMAIPKLVNPITAPLGIAEAAAGKAAVAGGIAGKAALKVNTNLQIAAVGVSSAAQIAAILSAGKSKSSGAGGGGGSVASAGGGAIPNAPTVAATAAPQITTAGGMNPTQQIGETISAAQRPIRAYVISGDVTSQQALDRRTSRAATFSAG